MTTTSQQAGADRARAMTSDEIAQHHGAARQNTPAAERVQQYGAGLTNAASRPDALTGADLLAIRTARGWTQRQMADRLAVSLRQYRRYETQDHPVPELRAREARRLARR